jgi:hypothetical protein
MKRQHCCKWIHIHLVDQNIVFSHTAHTFFFPFLYARRPMVTASGIGCCLRSIMVGGHTGLDWTGLNWTELNWIELNWTAHLIKCYIVLSLKLQLTWSKKVWYWFFHALFTVFIYSMPGYSCSIKERMLYSSCKAPLLDSIETQIGLPIIKKVAYMTL